LIKLVRERFHHSSISGSAISRGGPRAAFALVAALLLLMLLMVLAVGMLSLSALSLQSSGMDLAQAEARANARLALVLAMGELQRLAGPDQRVTATANLAGTADGGPLADGEAPQNQLSVRSMENGLSSVQAGTRHWTGVWQNRDAPEDVFTRTPSPRLLGWLVSGNEGRPAENAITPANPGRSAVLVGRHSAGGAPGRQVSAPLVELTGSRGSNRPTGRYAWWIGDEGVKAKLNLPSAHPPDVPVTEEGLAAPRRGWENVPGFENYPVPGGGADGEISKIITVGQAGLLDPSLISGTEAPLKRVFHAATAESRGVLADVLRGGLKLDLTAILADPLPGSPPPGVPHAPTADGKIIPEDVAPELKGPRWSALKEFHDLAEGLDGGVLRVKAAASDDEAAIAPVISDLRLLFGAKLLPQAGDGFRVQPCVKVAVALANPYAVPLRWDGKLELEIHYAGDPSREPSRIYGAAGKPAILPRTPTEPAVLNRAVFTIPPTTLPPGEVRVYTQAAPLTRPLISATSRVEIPLTPFASSDPANFSNAVILNHPSKNTINGTLCLEVREEQITSPIDVELKPAGSAGILCRIERFELDNPVFDITRRTLDRALAARFTEPFPLQLYRFQISRPGGDYAPLLSGPGELGLRGSTLRTFADFNVRATRFRKPLLCYNPPPYFMSLAESTSALPFTPPGGDTGAEFIRGLDDASRPWGRSDAGAGRTVLFSPPRRMVSLAQFQHADLTADEAGVSVAHQPGNAFGNSYASPFVKRSLSLQKREDFTIHGFNSVSSQSNSYHDIGYLLNSALWDGYYFSTVPRPGSGKPLNPRLIRADPEVSADERRDGKLAAAGLLVDGAFNVNSVEKDAWIALLAGGRHLSHPADDKPSTDALFPRSLAQPMPAALPPSGGDGDSFAGYRRLTDTQVVSVAEEITRQVRKRGPFLSLAHFVNRALVGLDEYPELGRSGALQAALDQGGANISPDGKRNAFTAIHVAADRVNLQADDSAAPRADMNGVDPTAWPDSGPDGIWPRTSRDENPGTVASILADREMLTDPAFSGEQGFRSTGIPGWLTQADVLQVIGSSLCVRSDTFRIRAYGEALDPASGKPVAKAWCEAVIQRMPGYMDATDAAEERGLELSETNHIFGRRFHVVFFRWLTEDEI